jgi:hypothetical protein
MIHYPIPAASSGSLVKWIAEGTDLPYSGSNPRRNTISTLDLNAFFQPGPILWTASGFALLAIPVFQILLHRRLSAHREQSSAIKALELANHLLFVAALALWFVYGRYTDPSARIRFDLLLIIPAGMLTVFLWGSFILSSRNAPPHVTNRWPQRADFE